MLISSGLWGFALLQRSPVLLQGLPLSLCSAALTLLLHALLRNTLSRRLSGDYMIHVFALILGFLLVLRLHTCYQRYWEGRSHLKMWGSKLADAVALAIALDSYQQPPQAVPQQQPQRLVQLPYTPNVPSAVLPLPPQAIAATAAAAPVPVATGGVSTNPAKGGSITAGAGAGAGVNASGSASPPTQWTAVTGGVGAAAAAVTTPSAQLPQSGQSRSLHHLQERQSSDRVPAAALYWQLRHHTHTVHEEPASAISEALHSHSIDPSLIQPDSNEPTPTESAIEDPEPPQPDTAGSGSTALLRPPLSPTPRLGGGRSIHEGPQTPSQSGQQSSRIPYPSGALGGGARPPPDRRPSGLEGGSSASTSWTPASAMVRSSLQNSSLGQSLAVSAAVDATTRVVATPSVPGSLTSSPGETTPGRQGSGVRVDAAPAERAGVFGAASDIDPPQQGASLMPGSGLGDAAAANKSGSGYADDATAANAAATAATAHAQRHFVDTILHLASLLHALGLASLRRDPNMSQLTVHKTQDVRCSGSSAERNSGSGLISAPLLHSNSTSGAPSRPLRPQPYTSRLHTPPVDNPQAVAESDQHMSTLPGGSAALYVQNPASATRRGVPRPSNTTFVAQTGQQQFQGATQHTSRAAATPGLTRRQSVVSGIPSVPSGIFLEDASAHGGTRGLTAIEQNANVLLPRGHSMPYISGQQGTTQRGSSSSVQRLGGDSAVENTHSGPISTQGSASSIIFQKNLAGSATSCWQQTCACCSCMGPPNGGAGGGGGDQKALMSRSTGNNKARSASRHTGGGWQGSDYASFKLPVIGGLSQDEGNVLAGFGPDQISTSLNNGSLDFDFTPGGMHAPGPQERPQVVHVWMQQALVVRVIGGGLGAHASILAQAVRMLAEAMHSFENCKKVAETPFPFAWTQACSLAIYAIMLLVPVLSAALSASLVVAVILAFLLVHLLATIHELAAFLANPFGSHADHFGYNRLQKRFNDRVLATAFVRRPAAFTDVSAQVAPRESGDNTLTAMGLSDAYTAPKMAVHASVHSLGATQILGKDTANAYHAFVERRDQIFHDEEASMKEASIPEGSEVSIGSSSGIQQKSEAEETDEHATHNMHDMHDPLQFGFDEDEGGAGGKSYDTKSSGIGTHALHATSTDVHSSEFTPHVHSRPTPVKTPAQRAQHSLPFDSNATLMYDPPIPEHQSSMHESHASHASHPSEILVTLEQSHGGIAPYKCASTSTQQTSPVANVSGKLQKLSGESASHHLSFLGGGRTQELDHDISSGKLAVTGKLAALEQENEDVSIDLVGDDQEIEVSASGKVSMGTTRRAMHAVHDVHGAVEDSEIWRQVVTRTPALKQCPVSSSPEPSRNTEASRNTSSQPETLGKSSHTSSAGLTAHRLHMHSTHAHEPPHTLHPRFLPGVGSHAVGMSTQASSSSMPDTTIEYSIPSETPRVGARRGGALGGGASLRPRQAGVATSEPPTPSTLRSRYALHPQHSEGSRSMRSTRSMAQHSGTARTQSDHSSPVVGASSPRQGGASQPSDMHFAVTPSRASAAPPVATTAATASPGVSAVSQQQQGRTTPVATQRSLRQQRPRLPSPRTGPTPRTPAQAPSAHRRPHSQPHPHSHPHSDAPMQPLATQTRHTNTLEVSGGGPVPRSPLGSSPPGPRGLGPSHSGQYTRLRSHHNDLEDDLQDIEEHACSAAIQSLLRSSTQRQTAPSQAQARAVAQHLNTGTPTTTSQSGPDAFYSASQTPEVQAHEGQTTQFLSGPQRRPTLNAGVTTSSTIMHDAARAPRMHAMHAQLDVPADAEAQDAQVHGSMHASHAEPHPTVAPSRLTAALLASRMHARDALPVFDFNPAPTPSSVQSSVSEAVQGHETLLATAAPLQAGAFSSEYHTVATQRANEHPHARRQALHREHNVQRNRGDTQPSPHNLQRLQTEAHAVSKAYEMTSHAARDADSLELPGLPSASETVTTSVSDVRSSVAQNFPEGSAYPSRSPLSIALDAPQSEGAIAQPLQQSETRARMHGRSSMHERRPQTLQHRGSGQQDTHVVEGTQSTRTSQGRMEGTSVSATAERPTGHERMVHEAGGEGEPEHLAATTELSGSIAVRRREETGETLSLNGSLELPAVPTQRLPHVQGSIYSPGSNGAY